MSLTTLPLEIRQQIADIIATSHWHSLHAFSLTNHACHSAAVPLIFRQIQFTVSHPDTLRRDVADFVAALSRKDSARHVQRISIKGDIRVKPQKTDASSLHLDEPDPSDGMQETLFNTIGSRMRRFVVYDEPVIVKASDEDLAWTPLANLLRAITCLKDLVFDCQSQFPPSLLEVLHKQHPRCRLHHLTFRFRTLLWGIPYPYEMELATSPSLYRLNVTCAWRDSDGDDDFNMEAAMDLASGLAPNLKEVSIVEIWPISCWSYDRRRRELWQGLPGFTGKVGGSLTSWSFVSCGTGSGPRLKEKWPKNTDMTYLQHLTFGHRHDTTIGISGDEMDWIAQNWSFPRLRTLSVVLIRDDFYVERPNYTENALSFFRGFKPLEGLSVYGSIDAQIMDTILSIHGESLRKLTIHPEERWFRDRNGRSASNPPMKLTKDQLSQFAILCPLLEEVSVPVRRQESRLAEAELYRCFGKMKSLRYLYLVLDCCDWKIWPENNSAYDRNPRLSHDSSGLSTCCSIWRVFMTRAEVRKILVNCAVDESLARSIWTAISGIKQGTHLERLKLWPAIYPRDLSFMDVLVNEMSRSWLLERNPRDDQKDPIVRELSKLSREYCRERWCSVYDKFDGTTEELFRSIWPCREQRTKIGGVTGPVSLLILTRTASYHVPPRQCVALYWSHTTAYTVIGFSGL